MEITKSQLVTYDFTSLLGKQNELDLAIYANNGVTRQGVDEERLLALFVEFGELANATRVFKFWSKKDSEERERLLDEYSDGLHFFLSLFLRYEIALPVVSVSPHHYDKKEISRTFLNTYKHLGNFYDKKDDFYLNDAYFTFIELGSALSFSEKDIYDAYVQKLVVNYERQKNNY